MRRDDGREPPRINVDEEIENADWLRVTWELPPYRSPEFLRFIRFSGLSLQQFRALRVYRFAVARGLIDEATDTWLGEGPQTNVAEGGE